MKIIIIWLFPVFPYTRCILIDSLWVKLLKNACEQYEVITVYPHGSYTSYEQNHLRNKNLMKQWLEDNE